MSESAPAQDLNESFIMEDSFEEPSTNVPTVTQPAMDVPAEVDINTPQGIFDRLDKDILLKHLRGLAIDLTINGKLFYKTYFKWEALTPDQRGKAFHFWSTNLSECTHLRLKVLIEHEMKNEASDETCRQSLTTYNDLARLLHLKVDPSAAVLWSEALREKSRLQLDDKEGHGGFVDAYDALASMFNDPSNKYQNACAFQIYWMTRECIFLRPLGWGLSPRNVGSSILPT